MRVSLRDSDEDGIGVRTTGREKGVIHRYDVLGDYTRLAAEGRFCIPNSRTFGWNDWRTAVELGANRKAHGKLILLTGT